MIRLLRNVLFLLTPYFPPVFSLDGLQKKCDPYADEGESHITTEADIECYPVSKSSVNILCWSVVCFYSYLTIPLKSAFNFSRIYTGKVEAYRRGVQDEHPKRKL